MAHILLPTDFSENSFHAGLYAARLFGTADHVYTLVHAYMDVAPSTDPWPGVSDEFYKAALDSMAESTARVKSSKEFAGAEVRSEVLYGPFPDMLNQIGKEKAADIVVMGTMGSAGAGLMGSNAGEVVKRSRLPVLVIPNQAELRPVNRILYADDDRHVEVAGSRMLLHIALRTKAEIVLAHVLKNADDVPDPEMVAMHEELFQAIPHRFTSAEGNEIAAAIDLMADQEKADMVAVVHRHSGFLEGLFHTSTAKRLALYTKLPLLVLQQLDKKA